MKLTNFVSIANQEADSIINQSAKKDFDSSYRKCREGIAMQVSQYISGNNSNDFRDDLTNCSDFPKLKIQYVRLAHPERQELLKRAIPKNFGMITLTIVRKKAGFANMYPKFFWYDQNQNGFFCNAKKMSGNKTSNYLVSTEEGVFSKDQKSYVGKLRSNYQKNKYLLYDNGENVAKNPDLSMSQIRCELGWVAFDLGGIERNGTRSVTVALPSIEDNLMPSNTKQLKKEDSIASKLKNLDENGIEDLMVFENQKPYWCSKKTEMSIPDSSSQAKNQQRGSSTTSRARQGSSSRKGAYVLEFSDNVKCSSIKNFQLVKRSPSNNREEPSEVFLEFGKISSSEFTLSLKWPFSIMNAFGIALSSFDK